VNSKYAIVTVTDSNFLAGTQVLLYSFLKNNPEFDGDIIILESDLKEKEKSSLLQFPNLRFEQPNKTLLERLEILSNYWPVAAKKSKHFYSLEIFRLNQYDKLLFLDSDMLCIGNLYDLFLTNYEKELLVVADSLSHNKKLREKQSFIPCEIKNLKEVGEYYPSFNSGFMMVNFKVLSSTTYTDLLKMINPIVFHKNQTQHSDQYLLNENFEGKVEFLDKGYNYLLNVFPKMEIDKIKDPTNKIKIIHYLEYTKPWTTEEPDFSFGSLWQEYYSEFTEQNNDGR